jgi:spoIIIJ-associated protein
MIFEAKTLEEAYTKAGTHFNKSISELEIKIIQNPSKGLFGFFSKNAIIEVFDNQLNRNKEKIENGEKKTENRGFENENGYFEYNIEEITIEDVVKIAKKEVNELFKLSCFEIDEIDVKVYDEETIIFEINGKDAALLIGKEGYRYNAISTMLFNWISQKYGYKVKLEIAEFLVQQEEMMRKFLEPTIREIEQKGRCKTKPFDGVLAYIALDILRAEFPDKYVAIKKNRDGDNYLVVNQFFNKQND